MNELLQQLEDCSCKLRAGGAAARTLSIADAGLLLDDACEARDAAKQLLDELAPKCAPAVLKLAAMRRLL
jgi:hypothetical protein